MTGHADTIRREYERYQRGQGSRFVALDIEEAFTVVAERQQAIVAIAALVKLEAKP